MRTRTCTLATAHRATEATAERARPDTCATHFTARRCCPTKLRCFTALAAAGRCFEPIHPQPPGLCMNPQASRLSTCTRCPLASERPLHTRLPSLQVGSLPCCPTRCRDVRIVLLSLDTRGAPGPACDGLRCIGGCCVCAPMRREGAHARTTSEGRTARSRSARLGVMSICAPPRPPCGMGLDWATEATSAGGDAASRHIHQSCPRRPAPGAATAGPPTSEGRARPLCGGRSMVARADWGSLPPTSASPCAAARGAPLPPFALSRPLMQASTLDPHTRPAHTREGFE